MRIESPGITHKDNRHVLSTGVSFESSGVHLPGTMWFAVDDADPGYAHGLTDAFLLSLIPTAMKLGEDIRVEGKVSSCLAHGVMSYQRILSTWWPESFSIINVDYECLADRKEDRRPSGVACALPPGGSALQAFMEWLPGNIAQNAYGVTHAMIGNHLQHPGDSPPKEYPEFISSDLMSGLAESGVELLVVHTNQDDFRIPVMPEDDRLRAHSSSLAACAHALAGVFGRFCISGHGGYAYEELLPSGSHPAMDHHLGSDQLQVVHLTSGAL